MIVVARFYDDDGNKIDEKVECDRHGRPGWLTLLVLGVVLAACTSVPQVALYLTFLQS